VKTTRVFDILLHAGEAAYREVFLVVHTKACRCGPSLVVKFLQLFMQWRATH